VCLKPSKLDQAFQRYQSATETICLLYHCHYLQEENNDYTEV